MRSKRKCPLVLVNALFLVATAAPADDGGKLTVRFTGLEKRTGKVLLSVANSRQMFESEDQAYLQAKLPVDGDGVTAIFAPVAAGHYAVKVFHDANDNGKLDIGLMGPKEKYGFSNNVMGFMGPPDFDDASFEFDGGALTVDIVAK